MNNIKSYSKLPYIYISELGGRFLLDTGASQSLINPKVFHNNPDFDYKIKKETHFIKTAHATSKHNQIVFITLPERLFRQKITHKFLIFNFDSDFVGLLGLDFLAPLNCKIDIKNMTLHTDTTKIPIRDDIKAYSKIEPKCEQVVNLLCNYKEGEYYSKGKTMKSGLIFPPALVTVKNGNAITTVINTSENKIILKNSHHVNLQRLTSDKKCINHKYKQNDENLDKLLKQNLERLRTTHMNQEEYREIKKLCYNYRDIFHCEEIPLTFTHEIKHQLRLSDNKPIYVRNYRQAPKQKEEIKTQINKLLEQNIIQESNSPWSCPVHIVPKKPDATGEQKYRLVIDYRKLNDKTIKDKYPLPNIDDILDKLGRAQYFTTLDLASGYHQVEMHPEDIEKTAFTIDRGHYEFLRMPFVLKNAPSTFQRLMDSVLRGIDNVLTYLDDVIIYSTSLQEHLNKCKQVFERFRSHNLKIQLNKSEFLQKQVKFLGHTLTNKGLMPNEDKIAAVKKFPIPKTQKEIKSFLGLVGYYRKFIQDFAKLTKPLTKCLKKGSKINLTPEYTQAFEKCKEVLINAPILQYPDFDKPFILTTDASDVAIGAVLSQGTIGTDKPVAYASRTLSDTEQKYSTIEKELLSIVWAIKYFRPYLYGKKFTIYTDHRPLTWIMSIKDPNSKLTRWRLRLAEYNYDVQYKKGKANTNADALSRVQIIHHNQLDNNPQPSTSAEDIDLENIDIRTLLDIPITPDNTSQPQETETQCDIIIPHQEQIQPSQSKTNKTSTDNIPKIDDAIDRQLKQFHIRKTPGDTYRIDDRSKGKIVIKDVWIPINNTREQIIQFLKEHTIPDRIFHCYFHHEEYFPIFCEAYKTIFNNRGPKLIRCMNRVTLIENIPEQIELIRKYHEGKTIHRGIQETYKHIHRNYHWPNMLTSIQKFINKCDSCLKSKYERNPLKLPLSLTDTPHKPMEHMFMDLYSSGGTTFLTIIDNFTKYAQAIPLTASTSIHIAEALLSLFSVIGVPKKITTDSDSKFDNEIITDICAIHNIHIHFTTPYNPNSNSPIERLHSTLAEIIRIQRLTDKDESTNLMKYAIIAYNNTIYSATGFTPFELLYGHTDSRNPLELHCPKEFYQEYVTKHKQIMENTQQLINNKLLTEKQQVIEKINKNKETAQFKVGDIVYKQVAKTARNNKLEPKYLGPYTIVRIHPEQIAEIIGKHVNAKTIRVHFRLLRRPENVSGTPSPASQHSSSPQQQQPYSQ
ncbi:unnamed protein product [Pieris macdunnoughi]|uniref:RNA-directed DNA polymerase n=1 Tax=Pieris macdunnoughi TaxID=345717 RepID=A0A821P795_9NEOP|nr:unnamed protein product [Pieris macdunnoughi]